MKNNFTTALFLIIILNTQAQYSLTVAHNMIPGDITRASHAVDTLAQEGVGGDNITWNFSAVEFIPSELKTEWVTPVGTPYDYVCPNATVSNLFDDTWHYFNYNTTGFAEEGFGNENVEELYSNSKNYFLYPFNYATIQKDTFYGERNGTTQGNITGTLVAKGDGYGKLILQKKNIENVLRIKIIEKKVVEIRGQTTTSLTESYQWFSKSQKCFVVSINRITTTIKNLTTGEVYITKLKTVIGNSMESIFTDVEKYVKIKPTLALYPNPAVNEVSVEFNSDAKTASTIDVMDVLGKKICSFKTEELASNKLNISAYPRGTYFVRATTNDKMAVQKLIIQ